MAEKRLKYNYVWWAILLLSFLPAILWLMAPSFSPRFSSFTTTILSLGKLSGLIGLALFSLNLILSSRFIFLDKYFKGLNNVYAKHSLIGQSAFILLLFHPLFLAFVYAGDSWIMAMRFLSFSQDYAKNLGLMALVLMILLVILTLYFRPQYHIWKLTHKFMGLAFYFASLHMFLIPSDVSRYAPLRFYMLSLVFLALAVFVFRTLLGRYLVRKYKYRVEKIESLNDYVYEITMKPQNKKLNFQPGQFIFVSFLDKQVGSESHPFSISSGPEEDNLKITVKRLGDYTNKLNLLSIGSMAKIEGPFGFFSHQNSIYNRQIWIAGGIGLTPFLSMAKSLSSSNDYAIDLFYCLKNASEAIHLNWLQQLDPSLKVHLFYYDQKGYINAKAIQNTVGSLSEKDIFICSPPAMIASLKKQFLSLGIDKKLIHSEDFNF